MSSKSQISVFFKQSGTEQVPPHWEWARDHFSEGQHTKLESSFEV